MEESYLDEYTRSQLVDRYFADKPLKPSIIPCLAIIFLGCLFIIPLIGVRHIESMSNGEMLYKSLAELLIGFGVVLVMEVNEKYKRLLEEAAKKPSDYQMDKWLREDMEIIQRQALQRLDMYLEDTSSAPLIIDGPAEKSQMVIGEQDRIVRFKVHEISVYCLTEHLVATFQCRWDMQSEEILRDETKEFPYKDITNLETAMIKSNISKEGKVIALQGIFQFGIYTSGVNKITNSYFITASTEGMDEYKLPRSDAEDAIKVIRKRLKEYKDMNNQGFSGR
jgi:hypothetical protein